MEKQELALCIQRLRERRGTIPGLIAAIEAKNKPKARKPRKKKGEQVDETKDV